ncbi:hypothetical protein G4B88_001268 [Cannabis sativa]|uniref:CCHC-type domain-containing protein n=1 Tax=Cannabis sativa TaxID=3483 RepID=A0A7J6HZN9_CANSA|nr:hypothetical protein G4B88_001268 [Cannabis sativa]
MVTIEVDTMDSMIAKTLERDSEMEIEMMDLFEDLSLEDIVANKACVGKVMGCKNMAASVVKKILMGIWNLEDVWRIKKFEDGVLGFFFESEADCTFVMNKRPWLVNGVLLNLKPWPIEGEVRVSEFELACFWVEFHGLPTRCLSENNIPLLAKKVGQLVKSGGKRKEETLGSMPEVWVHFKYEKLPYLCFNCGMLAHSNKDCSATTAWVTPPKGAAVRMYGPWIKVEGSSGSYFSAATYRREIVHCNEGAQFNAVGQRTRGNWKRRPLAFRKEDGEGSSQAPSDLSNPPNVFEMIVHLSGSKKRKAHQWYQPIPDKLKESPFEEEVHETGTIDNAAPEDKLTDADGKEITVEKIDLGFIGPKYTWMRKRGAANSVRKRLDRAITSADWCLQFPEAAVLHHPILASDHAPIAMDTQLKQKRISD